MIKCPAGGTCGEPNPPGALPGATRAVRPSKVAHCHWATAIVIRDRGPSHRVDIFVRQKMALPKKLESMSGRIEI